MKEKMMKQTCYSYSWDLVSSVYLQRYPTTPLFPMLLNHEISLIRWKVEDGLFYCEKRCTMFVPVPKVLQKISKVDHCYIYQNLVIDIPHQIMKESSWNRLDAKTYHMLENAVWSGDEKGNTQFSVDSIITISPKIPKPVARPVLKRVVKEFNNGYDLARKVDKMMIEDFENKITSLVKSIREFCDRQIEHQHLFVDLDFSTSFEYCFELPELTGKYI
ncbi:hypothetical protein EDI_185130 [Entamoeba dispar SAW760]|uniref:PRELI/MSF1 domain-containing protein n=1 Tax=Entamoeba dispar (strain ATCC PRA-260 / SAW760) TaxID=370354 RepID=B0ER75_ENTDS|nr:uncharacterized protein EDI_185130 [Entamoeba dispar SAW760]EDR22977.1 hypothetical protein EDI_185130 [Entamoeba dispar SAW760]|eukprot:EDR22977.1 hypothetical protein EDI_185130 [Entamoeba dispar SAW760]